MTWRSQNGNEQVDVIAQKDTSSDTAGAKSLRMLMATPRYFPFMGGVENHVYEVARRLARQGVDITVLTTDTSGQLPADELSEGIKIRRVRAWPTQRDYYFAPDVYRLIRRGDWDIVHIQSYHTLVAPLAMLAARRARIPYVLTFHGGGHSSRLRNAPACGHHPSAPRARRSARFALPGRGQRDAPWRAH